MLDNPRRKIQHVFHPKVGEIWMLHRVVEVRSENKEQADLEVTAAYLESLVADYRNRGFEFVSIDAFIAEIKKKSLRNAKKVCVTFDDGYRDNFELAYPLLKRLDVPFTIYVSMNFVDNKSNMWWYCGQLLGMTSEQLCILATEPLCTIGAHTLSHPKLDEFDEQEQWTEIFDSKLKLEEKIGKSIYHFSYPYGAHNQISMDCVKRAGFSSAVQSWGGASRRGDRCWELRRKDIKQ